MAEIDALLRKMVELGGSDLHLSVGAPPKARISGSIQAIADGTLTAPVLKQMLQEIVPERKWSEF